MWIARCPDEQRDGGFAPAVREQPIEPEAFPKRQRKTAPEFDKPPLRGILNSEFQKEPVMTEWFSRQHIFQLTFGSIALIYLILFFSLPPDSIWISDEGNRIMSVQAYALTGDKALPDPLAGIDRIPPGIRAYPEPYFIRRSGQWRSAYQLFFPRLAAWVYSAFGRSGVWFIAAAGGLATVLGAGLIARKLLKDDRAASLVMALCAFASPVCFYSGTMLETTCASAFAVFSVLLLLELPDEKRWIGPAAGVLVGISILFREEGFIFAAGTVLALLIERRSWKQWLGYGIGAALAVSPLLIYNYLDSGSIFGMHHLVYSRLAAAAGSPLVNQLKNYSFYLFLLCLPFWGQLNLVVPWVLLGGTALQLLPKGRNVIEGIYFSVAIVSCGASLWCTLMTSHGGVFIYQSLLDHLPLFALFLFALPVLLRSGRGDVRILTVISLTAVFLTPALLNHNQPGVFWGGRHFLNAVPLLCVLSAGLLTSAIPLSRLARTAGWILAVLSLAAGLSGYGVLSAKRNFTAGYVRELAKPEYQVILTDLVWMPEELAWIHREKCILLLTEKDSLDQARPFLRSLGIRKFHLLLGRNFRRITNESVQRTIDETEFRPGRYFRHELFGKFECQLFECTFKQ